MFVCVCVLCHCCVTSVLSTKYGCCLSAVHIVWWGPPWRLWQWKLPVPRGFLGVSRYSHFTLRVSVSVSDGVSMQNELHNRLTNIVCVVTGFIRWREHKVPKLGPSLKQVEGKKHRNHSPIQNLISNKGKLRCKKSWRAGQTCQKQKLGNSQFRSKQGQSKTRQGQETWQGKV